MISIAANHPRSCSLLGVKGMLVDSVGKGGPIFQLKQYNLNSFCQSCFLSLHLNKHKDKHPELKLLHLGETFLNLKHQLVIDERRPEQVRKNGSQLVKFDSKRIVSK